MAKITNRLTPQKIRALSKPGYYLDGSGLYLQISPSGTKSWIFKYTRNGKTREMGLGSLLALAPDAARRLANDARSVVASGSDPLEKRKIDAAVAALAANRARTFSQCAGEYIESHKDGWKNLKHAAQWRTTLRDYAEPAIGNLSVADIDTEHVVRILQKDAIWTQKNETANRVRQRIESILDWAKTMGYRTGENPARWRGHLDNLLPAPSKVKKVKHHAALPVNDLPYFMADLKQHSSISAKALHFSLMTAARTNEVVSAQWGEFDLEKAIWTVPAERMKAKQVHQVPLSNQAVALLNSIKPENLTKETYVFCAREGRGISTSSMEKVLDMMGYTASVQEGRQRVKPMPALIYPDGKPKPHVTVHGTCRSTFRDWVAEETDYPRDLAEMALAHTIDDKTEAAYRRGNMLERRRPMMQDWANWLDINPGTKATVMNIMTKGAAA